MNLTGKLKVVRVGVPAFMHFGVTVPVGASEDEIQTAALEKLHLLVDFETTHLAYADNTTMQPSHRRDPARWIEVHVSAGEELVEAQKIVCVFEDEDESVRTDGQATPLPEGEQQ